MRRSERWRVIQPVADHHHLEALAFQIFDARDLVGRCHAGAPLADPERSRGRQNRRLPIPREDLDCDATRPQRGNDGLRVGTHALTDREHMTRAASPEGNDRYFWIETQDLVGQLVGLPERRAAQPYLFPVDQPADALRRLLDNSGKRRFGIGGARHCGGDRIWLASASRPARSNTSWKTLAEFTTSSSGTVSVPVLSKTI
jgi:hypothetical protein